MHPARHTAAVVSVLIAATLVTSPGTAAASPPPPAALTNLAHLDFLTDTVAPPVQPGHSTYRLEREPAVGVLWVYADRLQTGDYRRTGGGAYDPATGTYGQGSYDADHITSPAPRSSICGTGAGPATGTAGTRRTSSCAA
jgi:hypothetical protein